MVGFFFSLCPFRLPFPPFALHSLDPLSNGQQQCSQTSWSHLASHLPHPELAGIRSQTHLPAEEMPLPLHLQTTCCLLSHL